MGEGVQGYQVDVDFLRDTVRKLQGITDSMDGKSKIATYQTGLGRAQLGSSDFLEANGLYDAHVQMQTLLKSMVDTLGEMLQEVTDRTGLVHRHYVDQEHETAETFRRQA